MTIFSRIKDILSSNIIHMLDRAEDPDKMVRLMIQEMEETLVEVKSSAAKLIAEQKTTEREIDKLRHHGDDWLRKAELAMSKEREDLARGALKEKKAIDDAIASKLEKLNSGEESLAQLKADIATLNDKLEDAKARQKSILMRQRSLQSQAQVQSTLDKASSAQAFAKFEQYEMGIDRLEGEVSAAKLRNGKSMSLKNEIEDLAVNEEIENQLAELRSKIAIKTSSEQGQLPS